ncbi:unnamed protein product [Ceutorhynchus assimilis]|uniref:Uncharacterized protein n=1 Tax=Ceutorhynchus assimilis TaxID=467358 RepID=A0A9N9MX92_9CUCU|nr:unnamed protein product [Ceutorhynchus assimilis]
MSHVSLEELYNVNPNSAPNYFHCEYDAKLMKLVREHLACLWVAGDVDLAKDSIENDCPENVKKAVKIALAFLMRADDLVVNKLCDVTMYDVLPDRQFFSAIQKLIEIVHREVYTKMVVTQMTVSEFERLESWGNVHLHKLFGWLDCAPEKDSTPYVDVSKWAAMEGIVFNFAFALFCWLRYKNLLPEFTKANEYIMRDEQYHAAAWLRTLGLLKDAGPQNESSVNPLKVFLAAHLAQDEIIELMPKSLQYEIRRGSDYLTAAFLRSIPNYINVLRLSKWYTLLSTADAELYDLLINAPMPEYLEASKRITKTQFLDNNAGGYEYHRWDVKQDIDF